MPNGIFDLSRNDNAVSSYYLLSDLVIMINKRLTQKNQITEDYLKENYDDLIQDVDGQKVIDEKNGFKIIWGPQGNRRIPKDWKLKPRTIDHYELVLYNIFTKVVGDQNVKLQYRIDNTGHPYDFMIDYQNQRYLIEFDGLIHFRGNNLENPLNKLDVFEHEDYKLILWPYWIQRCERNLKVVLGLEKYGLGAIWGSNYHFGDFPWNNSYEIITRLNQQFKIERNGGIGYVYETETEGRNNPENPVIANILNPKRTAWTIEKKLIPKGTPNDVESLNYWLPTRLRIEQNGL